MKGIETYPTVMALIRKGWALVALVAVVGCATYQPLPITPETVDAGLQPPDMNEVRLQAGDFRHSLLKPVPFDDRDGISPDEAAILAVLANPTLRTVRDQRGIAAAQLLQAGLLPNPRLSYDVGIPTGEDTGGRGNGFGLGLDWDISSLISRNMRLDAAKAHAASVDLDVAWQEWQVAQAARLHTYRLIIAGRRLATAKQAEASLHHLWEDTKRGVALGVKTRFDLSTAAAGLQQARSQTLNAQATMELERLAFNRALGLPAETMIPLEEDIIPQLGKLPAAETLFDDAETGRLDLRALRLGYESREARVRGAVRSRFPKINLGLTGSRDTDGLETVGVGLGMDLPFFDRGQGRIAEERASRRQLFDEYIARLFETRADIHRLLTAIEAARRRVTVLDESVSAQKNLAENCRRAVAAGQLDVFSCSGAENALYSQQGQRIELEQRMIDLGIALEIASGQYGLVSETGNRAREHGQTGEGEMAR